MFVLSSKPSSSEHSNTQVNKLIMKQHKKKKHHKNQKPSNCSLLQINFWLPTGQRFSILTFNCFYYWMFRQINNSFQTFAPFIYSLKTSENQKSFDDFRGYRNGTLAWTGIMHWSFFYKFRISIWRIHWS